MPVVVWVYRFIQACKPTALQPNSLSLRPIPRRIEIRRPHPALRLEPLPDIKVLLGWRPRVRMRADPRMLLV